MPAFAVHFDHHVQYYEFRITNASNGNPLHPVFSNFDEDEFVGRNLSPGNVFVFAWDGTRAHSNGNNNLRKVVPDGQYIIQLRVLKALGDENNPAHWETWLLPGRDDRPSVRRDLLGASAPASNGGGFLFAWRNYPDSGAACGGGMLIDRLVGYASVMPRRANSSRSRRLIACCVSMNTLSSLSCTK